MATDSCDDTCYPLVDTAYSVGWGGMILALLVTLAGSTIAAARRRVMVLWPVVGWLIFVLSYVAFLMILQEATGAVF